MPMDTCGIAASEDKIVNGKRAGIGQFPWMARIGYQTRLLPLQCSEPKRTSTNTCFPTPNTSHSTTNTTHDTRTAAKWTTYTCGIKPPKTSTLADGYVWNSRFRG
ncbi:hypothetical protein B566_EDAN016474 [Ephemera danica]|nr:hypothetical protein B566_EDAN016474 [Ephemera danica]